MIPQQFLTALEPLRLRWNSAYAVYSNPATRTPAVTQEKNDAKKAYKAALRTFIQGQIMRNPLVSDASHRSIGLSVYDRKPTLTHAPETRTEVEVDFSQIMQHTLRVRDSESKSVAKPPRVIGFELWRRIGGDTTLSFQDMEFVGLVTRSPYIVKYTSADRGKTVCYASRWVSTRGQRGPWSEIISAIIP
jgi:hypothetical protein